MYYFEKICGVISMSELYEKQEDGTLGPVQIPERLTRVVYIYQWLKAKGFSLDEIKFLFEIRETY